MEFNFTSIDFVSERGTLLVQQCRDWCLDQHVTKAFENEWLVVWMLMFLVMFWMARSVGPSLQGRGPEIAKRLESGFLVGLSLLIASYAWLISRAVA